MSKKKQVLLAPLDPVHDIGLKMIRRGLEHGGHKTHLLPPDLPAEEIIQEIINRDAETVLISRTLGYGVAELLARFVDLVDAAGLRDKVTLGIGGMAIRPELAAELGFDAGFGPGTTVEEAVAFVEGKEFKAAKQGVEKKKVDITSGYSYQFINEGLGRKIEQVAELIIQWAENKTSPGVRRAVVRDELWDVERWRNRQGNSEFDKEYPQLCGEQPRNYYFKGELHPKTRRFTREEVIALEKFIHETKPRVMLNRLQHTKSRPVVFNQYGTGCPFMDIGHIKVSEAWGADGVVHFDPSWGARTEGFFDGFLTHQEDGTVITPANLNRIHGGLEPSTLWQVRAHRGLNTPETVVLGAKIGADLTKINICYGSLGAGTDPERLTVDGYHAIRYAAKYKMPFDVVTNEELAGVPAHKAFAGMLIVSALAVKLGGRPMLQPLFAYSPEAMISEQMEDNYVDFNAAKIYALKSIIDAPIWPGAPIGFLTQTEDRVQSSTTTALHACLASSLGVDAISIASSDEAYSGGPIAVPSRTDTLKAVGEGFRFFGGTGISPSERAKIWAEELTESIEAVVDQVIDTGDFVEALYQGVLGNREEGAYPGRAGKGTVRQVES
ncbi:cobalamin-dependent protein [Metallumcola ferriviriculae]|uniref:Cobalamin-dependent protein n=1 Tax=Metallumcola ferriviriculae TaxID=3039180 RepID=A0AAU0UNZ6_9FIRM|nr:cobalamin-dependent protein [Desulfitibacteraceae bacterium MK1]